MYDVKQKSLRRSGLRTVMTRSDDRFVTLDQRVAIANSHRDAIFMCIHFNSAVRSGARGIETYLSLIHISEPTRPY